MNNPLITRWALVSTRFAPERGATTTEYALVTILIAIVAMVALVVVGEETSDMYTTIADEMTAAATN